MAKSSTGSKNYGRGEFDANPFFGGEETEFKGKPYTIVSPHGSEFGVGYLTLLDDSEMAEAIENEQLHGGIKSAGRGKKGRK
jgi:hypothetical protein